MRIVAGKHRGLSLFEFDADNIRPTTDRVRENIFNKIQFGVLGSSVLDLFCGTGAVSLEFLSRGAKSVVSVDNNKNSIALIRKNFAKAKERLCLLEMDYKKAVETLKDQKFDYIFLDPPYKDNFGEDSLKLLSQYGMLAEDGVIVYEHLQEKQFVLPDDFELFDEKKYGTIKVSFIRRKLSD